MGEWRGERESRGKEEKRRKVGRREGWEYIVKVASADARFFCTL